MKTKAFLKRRAFETTLVPVRQYTGMPVRKKAVAPDMRIGLNVLPPNPWSTVGMF